MKISIGIDPDLHTLPIAVVVEEGGVPRLEGIWTVKRKGSKKETAVVDIISSALEAVAEVVEAVHALPGTSNAVVVTLESQNVTYTGRTNLASPQDLIYLAQVAGGCVAALSEYFETVRLVQPSVWKKTMPKRICQARAFSKLGLEYSIMGGSNPKQQYCVPEGFKKFDRTGNLNKGDFKDAGDSVALAFWGLNN